MFAGTNVLSSVTWGKGVVVAVVMVVIVVVVVVVVAVVAVVVVAGEHKASNTIFMIKILKHKHGDIIIEH